MELGQGKGLVVGIRVENWGLRFLLGVMDLGVCLVMEDYKSGIRRSGLLPLECSFTFSIHDHCDTVCAV